MEPLKIYLLGEFRVYRGEERVDLPTKPIKSLFAYLLTHRERGFPPELLAGTFWGERSEERARASLHNALRAIRKALPGSIITEYGDIRFNPALECWLDIEEFERKLQGSRGLKRPEERLARLQSAVKLYQGDFMEGFYEDWSVLEQERLRELYLDALKELVDCHKALKEYDQAIACCKRILERAPLREEVHRELIYLYYLSGDRNAALLQYKECCQLLKKELGVEPLPETKALFEEIQEQAELEGLKLLSDRLARAKLLLARYPELRAPFVGRADELARLIARWERAKEGRGGLVLIAGEAGAGKTRLAHELLSLISKEEASVLIGNCYRPGAELPYQPLVEALRGYLPKADPDRLKGVKPLWLAEVAKLVPELGEFVKLPEDLTSQCQPQPEGEEQWRLHLALTEFLFAFAEEGRPLFIFLDDLHQADESTIQYLHYLAHHLSGERILVLGTYRTEELGGALAELIGRLYPQGLLEQMSLSRLSREEAATLIRKMLKLAGEGEFIEKIYQETEGNPLFIIELLKGLIEGGALYIEEGRWRTPSAEAIAAHVPPTVGELISQRLRRLSPRGRKLLELAAVAGQEVELEVLAGANGSKEGELTEILEELTGSYLLQETERGCRFSHELIRQAVYEGLGPLKRRRLHLRVGEALEAADPQRIKELAHHFSRAGRWGRAFAYLMEAATQAERVYALKEALAYLERAEAALSKMGLERPSFQEREFELLVHRVDIQGVLGRRAEQEVTKLFGLAQALGDEAKLAEAHRRRAELLLAQGRYQEAQKEAEEELAITRRLGDKMGQALALKNIGAAYGYLGDYIRALEHFELTVELMRELQDQRGEAAALGNCGLAHYYLGRYEQALATLESARRLSAQARDKQGEGRLLNNLGVVHWRLGDYPKALEAFTAAHKLAEEIGDRRGELDALGNIGALYIELGRYHQAKELQESVLKARQEIGDRRGEGLSLYSLGIIARCSGRAERALEYLHQALRICRDTSDGRREAVTLNELGFTYHILSKEEEALEQLERAAEVGAGLKDPVIEIENLAYRSMVHLASGEAEAALECSKRAVALLEASGSAESPQLIYFNHSKILATRGMAEGAKEYLEKAYDEVRKRADRIRDKATKDAFLMNVMVNREIVARWRRERKAD
ncbi:MAG: tetratricopeptide repeat protein [Candidatus Bipolaricaulia bacterium]